MIPPVSSPAIRKIRTGKIRTGMSVTLAFAAMLLAGSGPAATETAVEPAALDTTQPPTEIQRFCSNIADAARDRRYAIQARELQSLQAEIDKRIKALEEKRAEYEEWLQRREKFLAGAEDNVVKIYARMRPDAAAERLADVQPELAAGILMKLDSRQAGVILNEMERKAAATLTGIMASAARKEDPA